MPGKHEASGISNRRIACIGVLVACVAGLLSPTTAGAANPPRYVEGDVIVTFKSSASLDSAKSALSRKSMAFSHRFGWLSAKRGRQTGLVRHGTKTTQELIAELKDDPEVETVEPNYLRWISADPNDARFSEMWALHNTGQTVANTKGTSGDDVKFDEAWNLSRLTNDEVVVGVIDTGVDYLHPDLAANMWHNKAEQLGNNRDNDSDGYANDYYGYDFLDNTPDPEDSGYHGTHVAGTIAAVGNNGAGTIGVNYRAKIMALRVSSDGDTISTSAVIEAIQYATMMKNRGVNIVALNASYGGGGYSNAEKAAIQAAGNAGIILCAAAGNESSSNDVSPTYPANYRLPNMIVVAATDQDDALADFSNYGVNTVDIAAPGTNILSTEPGGMQVEVGGATYIPEPLTYSGKTVVMTAPIYYCGLGNPADFPAAVRNNIALIQRGTLTFAEKVTNAMAAGAKAVLIYNNAPGGFLGTLGTTGDWVPAGSISQAEGLAIKGALPTSAAITVSGNYQYLDGTSMATPHVTGAVAFAAMNFPKETVAQRVQRILSSVDIKPALSTKVATHGRLNLLRTVDLNANGTADWLEKSSAAAPTITTTTPLEDGHVSFAYSQTMTAAGGSAPYAWSVISGALPAGLTLSTAGVLSGTPTTPGTTTFALQVKDSHQETSALMVSLYIEPTPLAITSSSTLTPGKAEEAYTANLSAIGGTPEYEWSVTGGALPSGLSLTSAGALTGTPVEAGSFTFTAQVADGGLQTVSQSFTLAIAPQPLNITTPSPLLVGALSVSYSHALAVTGGTGTRTWSVSEGNLPDGLTLSAAGLISGVPTAEGVFNFSVLVTDAENVTLAKSFSLTIEESPVVITTAATLIAGVKNQAYSQTFTATGGTGPYTWARTGGALPAGLTLSTAGVLSGKPTVAGVSSFTVTTTDHVGYYVSHNFSLTVTANYVKPVVDPIDLGTTTIGMYFSKTVTATNYPSSFAITHLPPGLTYVAAKGIISGRPTTAGTFNVEIKALNPGNVSDIVIAPLKVNAVSEGLIGAFTGIIDRNALANNNLGGRLNITTTSKGNYTAKVTVGGLTKSITGYLLDTAPHIIVVIGNGNLSLTLNKDTHLVSGTHGTASVTGWRSDWSAAHPATTRVGYYTVGMDLTDVADQTSLDIPHGSGYASFTVAAAGALTVAGKTADGAAFTSAGFIGPNGEIAIYSPLYTNLGSLVGVLHLTEDANQQFLDNTVSGSLTWQKFATKTRTYPGAFGPVNLSVYGKYLAVSSSKGITLGLPATGTANLAFSDGGIEYSDINPNVDNFTYTQTKTISIPKTTLTENLGHATLTINKTTGLIGGAFVLVEASPALTRRVTFQGMIVRPPSGDLKALGYFLLPQIPLTGETINTSPILSGKVIIDQPPAQ